MVFFSLPWLITETWVTSLPVPAVVGTVTTGRLWAGRPPGTPEVFHGLARAWGNGRGELCGVQELPPPMPMTPSALCSRLRAGTSPAHAGELGVGLHLAENGHDGGCTRSISCSARGAKSGSQRATQRVMPSSGRTCPGAFKLPCAEVDLHRLGVDKLKPHRSRPQWPPPGRRTCACSRHASPPDPGTRRCSGRSSPSRRPFPAPRSSRPCRGRWRC